MNSYRSVKYYTKMYETSFRSSNDFITGMHGIRADMITGITRDLMDGT